MTYQKQINTSKWEGIKDFSSLFFLHERGNETSFGGLFFTFALNINKSYLNLRQKYFLSLSFLTSSMSITITTTE